MRSVCSKLGVKISDLEYRTMSPASKSKSKASGKAAKEQQKAAIKPSGSSTNTGNGTPASAYNPISGTFHTLDTASIATSPPYQDNGRFRNIDETDEHSSSPHGTVSEYDSISNNGSCSGESEDTKDKFASSTPRPETIPGSDNDRREKIRLKNEKKHQRQKEKRAQELHDRCCGYLMSRKLEALSAQLVGMGFSSEQATLALMLNDGRVEESVNWLLNLKEEARNKDRQLESGGNLKINITEELARISEMEVRYKCSKQEVERAVVACEGDLDKAEDTVKAQKQEPPATSLNPDDTADIKNQLRPQEKLAASITIQQRRNERDFNYTKAAATVPTYSEPGSRNLQPTVTNPPKSLPDKRWATTGSSPSVSIAAAAPMQVVTPTKVDVRHAVVGNEGKNIQQVREPVVVMQRQQPINAKQIPVSSITASPSITAGWYAKNVPVVENVRPNGKVLQSMGNVGTESWSSEQFYHQAPYKETQYAYSHLDTTPAGLGGSWSRVGTSPSLTAPSRPRGSWSTLGGMSSPSLAVPSSLGLFASWGSAGTLGSSHVDWNTGGLMPECDYNSIDWTLNTNLSSSKTSGLWLGLSSLLRNGSGMRMGSTNGLQDGGVVTETSSSAGLREWTSPFAEKDIFSVPRQFVTSPSP
ncbi:hypothetical protein Patl1_05743 [Pistacia atlantica]|uniref:Uncharacterized protein n=1 Tax=Pistacia atlantica TaxID=434234 RepID=A0ACC1BUH6_9ROSI|nr:hypothetical protein Patl1_05743 [Pistacia atlantica]